MRTLLSWPVACLLSLTPTLGCGGGGTAAVDAGVDAKPTVVSTEQCEFIDVLATSGTGSTVVAGALTAGAAEAVLTAPVGTAMGGYTARAGFGGNASRIDNRKPALPGTFNASVGIENAPKVKAVALTSDGETVVMLKMDVVFVYEGLVFDLEQRLGSDFNGKVLIASSHTHSGWAQFTGHNALKLGASELRDIVYQHFLDDLEAVARAALAARRPAALGIFVDDDFDPNDLVTHDRRGENDPMMGGPRKDDQLVMIRVDGTDGEPIAIVPIYGIHGTLNGEANPVASADASGAMERALEEQFDHPVVVMHLNSAGGDVSPASTGGLDCTLPPGDKGDPCFEWTREEIHGRTAAPLIRAAWESAGANLQTSLAIEMVSRSIELGPDPATFTIRNGDLSYTPFDGVRTPDGIIYEPSGALASPIDEFNAPVGAALCETETPLFPAAVMPGAEGIAPYGSCLRLDAASDVLGAVFNIDFEVGPTDAMCQTTRTTISALRLGDYVLSTLPGEATVMIKDLVRETSPVDEDHTIVVGYAQGHVGYLLRPEDWVLGGYESTITFWGPLEAEHIVEKAAELAPLVMMAERQNGAAGGVTRVATQVKIDNLIVDNPAPSAGTVPAVVPSETWLRSGAPATAQPAAQVPRVSGLATFVWNGDDPLVKTPSVRLEVETTPGIFVPALRYSGRPVTDQELVLTYTPQPLRRVTGEAQTHLWALEWQAVPWQGSVGVDGYNARGGLPLGNYRFHVEGDGWTLNSDAFAVVAGGLATQIVTSTPSSVTVTVQWHAPRGWRAMDATLPSNRPVPVRSQGVTVAMKLGATTLTTVPLTTDANGSIVAARPAGATSMVVTDQYGNSQSVTLP